MPHKPTTSENILGGVLHLYHNISIINDYYYHGKSTTDIISKINGKKHFLDYILVCSDKNESENKKGNSKKNHNMKGKNKEFEDGCPDSYDFTMFTSKNRKLG